MADYVAIVGENVADVLMGPTRVGDGTAQLRVFSGGGPANTCSSVGQTWYPNQVYK